MWSKGAGGGKGGGRGNIQVENTSQTEVIDIGASGSVKNMGKLASRFL